VYEVVFDEEEYLKAL